MNLHSFPAGFKAIVVGATGGIGSAIADHLDRSPDCGKVIRLSRTAPIPIDVTDEASIISFAERTAKSGDKIHLIFDATGALTIGDKGREKSHGAIEPLNRARAFATNAIGPALILKHRSPLRPRTGKCAFATLSARVGSIEDNRLGGWYAYRASKAALNQIVKTASYEIARKRPEAVCLALHPGTVATRLSEKHANGTYTHSPKQAAQKLLGVIDVLDANETGGFFDYDGRSIPW